jgi:transcription antitermination factor NusG
VTITAGPFASKEGAVDAVTPEGLVRVLVTSFGRQEPVEVERWQIAEPGE